MAPAAASPGRGGPPRRGHGMALAHRSRGGGPLSQQPGLGGSNARCTHDIAALTGPRCRAAAGPRGEVCTALGCGCGEARFCYLNGGGPLSQPRSGREGPPFCGHGESRFWYVKGAEVLPRSQPARGLTHEWAEKCFVSRSFLTPKHSTHSCF